MAKLLVSQAALESNLGQRGCCSGTLSRAISKAVALDPDTGKAGPQAAANIMTANYSRDDYRCVVFSPDCKTVAVGDRDGSTHLFDVSTGGETRCLYLVEGDPKQADYLAFSPDGKFLAVGSSEHAINARLWNVTTGEPVRVFHLVPYRLQMASFLIRTEIWNCT